MTPEKLREYRKKLREQGICVRCHRNPTNGRALCVECNTTLKRTLETKRAKGVCHDCLRPKDRYGASCSDCLVKVNARSVHKKRERKEAGRCPECGGERDDPRYVQCVNCMMRNRDQKQLVRSLMV